MKQKRKLVVLEEGNAEDINSVFGCSCFCGPIVII